MEKSIWDYVLEALEPSITPALRKIEQDLANQNLPVQSAVVTVARTLLTDTKTRQNYTQFADWLLEDDDSKLVSFRTKDGRKVHFYARQ